MKDKIYRLYGIDVAIEIIRPGSKYTFANGEITSWDDPRTCPTKEEIEYVLEKLKEFEDSVDVVLLPEHEEIIKDRISKLEEN